MAVSRRDIFVGKNESISPNSVIKRRSPDSDEEGQIRTPLIKPKNVDRIFPMKRLSMTLLNIFSGICCCFFLLVLEISALLSYFYRIHIKREHKYTPSVKPAYPMGKPKKSIDLRYYAQLLGLELSTHKVITQDGFVIDIKHLTDPKRTEPTIRPVLMLHGLLQSSGAFLTGGYKSLAYMLVKNGYDVWLGNNRCGFNPQHIEYDPSDYRMWDWDLTEMCRYDLTAMIDQIFKITGFSGKLSLVGHSQGTSQIVMFLSSSMGINYADKIENCTLLAPAIFGGPMLNQKLFIKFMRFLPDPMFDLFFGRRAFIPILISLRNMMYKSRMYGLASYSMFSYLFDSNDYKWDVSLRDVHFLFSPVYQSTKLMKWWLKGQGFRMGRPIMSTDSSWFRGDTPRMLLIIGGADTLVDGKMFYDYALNKEPFMKDKVESLFVEGYNHLDVLWSDDIQDTVGKRMLRFLDGE